MNKKFYFALSLLSLISFDTTYAAKIAIMNEASVAANSYSEAHFRVGDYIYNLPTQTRQIIKTPGATDVTISLRNITFNGIKIPAKFYQSCGQTTVHLNSHDLVYVELVASKSPIDNTTWFNCIFTTHRHV